MKLTKSQLKRLIREELKNESLGVKQDWDALFGNQRGKEGLVTKAWRKITSGMQGGAPETAMPEDVKEVLDQVLIETAGQRERLDAIEQRLDELNP